MFLLQVQSGGIGVVDLANEIEASVANEPNLRQKLWENIAATLGNDFSERLDRTFDASYATRSLAVYAMGDVPALQFPSDPRITAVRFRVDLSRQWCLRCLEMQEASSTRYSHSACRALADVCICAALRTSTDNSGPQESP